MSDAAIPASELDAFAALAEELADIARPLARRYFRRPLAIDDKADASPVTVADREIEAALRARLAEAVPSHGILGEEHGAERTGAEYVWVIDPIDGTKSFITGKPLFGTLIALVRNGVPVLGVVEVPALGERWSGAAGRPTRMVTSAGADDVRTRPCRSVADALMYATSPHMFPAGPDAQAFARLRDAVKHPLYGADCYAYGLLAGGFVDLVCEASLQPYDFCALVPVVEGAGGVITDWQGGPLRLHSDGRVLAAGDARAHAEALRRLAAPGA